MHIHRYKWRHYFIVRSHQKPSRKVDACCISRMYVTAFTDGHVEVTYISVHTAHELGTSELPHLPLPKGVKEEVALKISMGIPSERIMEGIYSTADVCICIYNYTSSILVVDIDTDNILNHCCRYKGRYRQPYQKRVIRTVCSSKTLHNKTRYY